MTVLKMKRIASALLVAILLLSAVSTAFANDPAPRPGQARFEVDFMTGMIDHHAMAIDMAQVCVEKATHDELRAMCEEIIQSQSEEIKMMQMWLMDWYGVSHEPQMSEEHKVMLEHLASLSGAQFEIEFMQVMIEHHSQAVKEGVKCERRAYHDELRNMCANMVQSQLQEIVQMQNWLCEWYGVCDYRRMM